MDPSFFLSLSFKMYVDVCNKQKSNTQLLDRQQISDRVEFESKLSNITDHKSTTNNSKAIRSPSLILYLRVYGIYVIKVESPACQST